jgi:hypothetical protein
MEEYKTYDPTNGGIQQMFLDMKEYSTNDLPKRYHDTNEPTSEDHTSGHC